MAGIAVGVVGIGLVLDRQGLFLRMGRVEVYARRDPERAWFLYRAEDGMEASAGRFRVTVSRAPAMPLDRTL